MSKTLQDKLTYLFETKEAIKGAIQDKGVTISNADSFRSYATKIEGISGGGGSAYDSITADWPDIKAIVETEDDEVNKYKCLFLLTNYTPEYEYIENYGDIVKIKTSDGEEYNNEPFTHVWDESQDINGKYRYLIFYSNNQNFSFLKDYRPIGIAYNDLATKHRTDFSEMFRSCSSLQAIPELNTEKGTDFNSMFYGCRSLQTIPELNTGLGTNFKSMFNNCSSLQAIPELNTEKGTDFSYMFRYCYSLQTIPELNTKRGTNFSEMFYICYSLQTIPELNTGLGTDFSYMFSNCYSLQTIYLLFPSFKEAVSFNSSKYLTYDTLIGIFESLPTVVGKTITITSNSNSKLSVEDKKIATNKGWTISISG